MFIYMVYCVQWQLVVLVLGVFGDFDVFVVEVVYFVVVFFIGVDDWYVFFDLIGVYGFIVCVDLELLVSWMLVMCKESGWCLSKGLFQFFDWYGFLFVGVQVFQVQGFGGGFF